MVSEFSKPPWEFTEQDIQDFVREKTPEDGRLDYKRSDLLLDKANCVRDLTKIVSAFNNAEGGVVIVGIREGRDGGLRYPEAVDDGVPEAEFTSTWLNQIINSNIGPLIHDLRTVAVPLSNGEGQVAFVIWVPRGNRAVQASDLKYYQRQGDRSEPMKDFQVRDVNNRIEGPDISLRIEFPDNGQLKRIENRHKLATTLLTLIAHNRSDIIPKAVVFRLIIPASIKTPGSLTSSIWSMEGKQPKIMLRYKDDIHKQDRAIIFTRLYPANIDPPLFSGWGDVVIGTFELAFRQAYENIYGLEPVLMVAAAPQMETRLLQVELSTNGYDVSKHVLDGTERTITLDDLDPLEYFRTR